ncbi:MAG: HNH endonuclease, partial [Candidatus Promineofilum sp.]|nr:HNH endonuclease [Promineifilum sp.]
MKLFVAPTDHDWYMYLRGLPRDEVNFWFPSAGTAFRALESGEPFLFKAKSPHNAIIGGGFFVRYVAAPLSLAWHAFGDGNGAPDSRSLLKRLRKYNDTATPDPEIGCALLAEPFFFPEELWVDPPPNWAPTIVRGKTYSTDEPVGASLWNAVVHRMTDPRTVTGPKSVTPYLGDPPGVLSVPGQPNLFGTPTLMRRRLGQGAFRLSVLDAYGKRCAV